MKYEFSDKSVTPWGGMLQMKRLIDKTGIRDVLEKLKLPQGASNNSYESVELVESFFVSVWIGASRFSHTGILRLDEALKKIFGWKRVASGTTLGRFFQKFSWEENNRVFPALGQWFFQQLHFDKYTLDVDSSILTRYGDQQGSKMGYNPRKKGRKSHHPLFAFVADTRMVANCWLRSGDTSSASNCIAFLEETFQILQDKTVALFRADSGFCSEKIFAFLEKKKIAYVIAGRMHVLIQHRIKDIQNWNVLDKGLWISEFNYQAKGWTSNRRVVVIRQSVALRPKASGKMLKLFDDGMYYEKYRFHCFITNQDLPATEIWEQYKRRADAENRIQELKQDFGAEGFCMKSFYATEAALRMVMMSYNLMALYRIFSQQTLVQQRLSTLRLKCFAVGSWVVKKGKKQVLKMAVPVKRREWFTGLFGEIARNQLPLSLQT